MDLVSSLKDDHEIIRKFIHEIESSDSLPVKAKIFSEMLIFVRAHFRAEETALYAKSLRSAVYELNDLALDGYEEHHLLDDLVYRIKGVRLEDPAWHSRVSDYCQILDLHLVGEEADFFPELKNYYTGTELDRAAVVYLKARKSELILAEQELNRDYGTVAGSQLN